MLDQKESNRIYNFFYGLRQLICGHAICQTNVCALVSSLWMKSLSLLTVVYTHFYTLIDTIIIIYAKLNLKIE